MFESKKRVMEELADVHSWEPVDTVSMIFETLEKTREDMKQAAEEALANQRREWADIVRLRQEQRKKTEREILFRRRSGNHDRDKRSRKVRSCFISRIDASGDSGSPEFERC